MATAIEAIEAAELKLATAFFGLEDMEQRPDRFQSGLMNAVVFARMATLSLQNMRNEVPEFESWYSAEVQKMGADAAMTYFRDLRNQIEKTASKTVYMSAHARITDQNMSRFYPPPPGGKSLVLGHAKYGGASGWIIEGEDGEESFYFIDVPKTIFDVNMFLIGAPETIANVDVREAVRAHLKKLDAIVKVARDRFVIPTRRSQ